MQLKIIIDKRDNMGKFSGFYKLSLEQRLIRIKEFADLGEQEIQLLKDTGALGLDVAERMIENVIGALHLPMGLGVNFKINGNEYAIPMAIEEASVIAAASNGAKLCLPEGFLAEADEPVMIGQMQVVGLKNAEISAEKIKNAKEEITKAARELMQNMEKRGGGFRNMYTKTYKTSRGEMLVIYFDVDVRDAMGANTINTLMEGIAPLIADCIHEGKVRLRIISNLTDKRKARARAVWKKEVIGAENIEGILDAYEFAKVDKYRAVTHNKGIMNGIGALMLATGNDWRATEAGAHAYASYNKEYGPLTHYEKDKNQDLVGTIELPMAVGIVGGSINSNPIAKITLKILGVKNAKELAMIAACVGLANNFAALNALATVGIQKGHMELHAKNLAAIAGANADEIESVSNALVKERVYKVDEARKILEKIRKKVY